MRTAARSVAAGVVAILCACAAPPRATPVDGGGPATRTATAGEMARIGAMLRGRPRAEVEAMLGAATRIRFDSGHEVWVYRFVDTATRPDARDALSELVLLLTPSGTVDRFRVRSPPA